MYAGATGMYLSNKLGNGLERATTNEHDNLWCKTKTQKYHGIFVITEMYNEYIASGVHRLGGYISRRDRKIVKECVK